MSELLVGFDMPTDMAVCLAIDNGIVYAKTEQMKDWKRLDGVSVHHIPPHGDLIDRDVLLKRVVELEQIALNGIQTYGGDIEKWKSLTVAFIERTAFKNDLRSAPTVIEAEEANGCD